MQTKMLRRGSTGLIAVAIAAVVAGCSGGAAQATPAPSVVPSVAATLAPTPSPAPSVAAAVSAAPSVAATASPPPGPGGPASLEAPATVGVGGVIEVTWTGPNANKDYLTVVPVGATKWTTEPYVYTTTPSPAKLPAPTKVGNYEIWYVNGADDVPSARRPIVVNSFTGSLDAQNEVMAGSPFKVAWTGPNGPSDYVTVVPVGAAKWTTEPYFYTANGSPGTLVSNIKAGAYEIWYVTGQDPAPQARRPLTVTPMKVSLTGPPSVKAGATFTMKWEGPNGPSDYITIVPKGSAAGTYTNFSYTASGNPVTLKAPDKPGDYEVWYASDRVAGTFGTFPIKVE